jgi:transcription antitermination protein NusB
MTVAPQATTFRERRSAARLAAIQALYALEVSGGSSEHVLADFVESRWSAADQSNDVTVPDERYLRLLVEGAIERREEIDAAIEGALMRGWTLARLEILLRAILRTGICELLVRPDVPTKVIINEFVNIAHGFFSEKEPGLVNAVLDRVAGGIRARLDGGDGHG